MNLIIPLLLIATECDYVSTYLGHHPAPGSTEGITGAYQFTDDDELMFTYLRPTSSPNAFFEDTGIFYDGEATRRYIRPFMPISLLPWRRFVSPQGDIMDYELNNLGNLRTRFPQLDWVLEGGVGDWIKAVGQGYSFFVGNIKTGQVITAAELESAANLPPSSIYSHGHMKILNRKGDISFISTPGNLNFVRRIDGTVINVNDIVNREVQNYYPGSTPAPQSIRVSSDLGSQFLISVLVWHAPPNEFEGFVYEFLWDAQTQSATPFTQDLGGQWRPVSHMTERGDIYRVRYEAFNESSLTLDIFSKEGLRRNIPLLPLLPLASPDFLGYVKIESINNWGGFVISFETHQPWSRSVKEYYLLSPRCPECRTDFDRDGTIGVQDIFSFLDKYFKGFYRADFSRDGQFSNEDIFQFLAERFQGCGP